MNTEEVKQRIESLKTGWWERDGDGSKNVHHSEETMEKVNAFCNYWQLFSDTPIDHISGHSIDFRGVEIFCGNQPVRLRVNLSTSYLNYTLGTGNFDIESSFDLEIIKNQKGDQFKKNLHLMVFNQILQQFKFASRYVDIIKEETK